MSKTYAEKLHDPRWELFRQRAFRKHGLECRQCGEDKPATERNHVHHLRYINGREPWEYEIEDVMILCKECHDIIHNAEHAWRDVIRAMPPWAAVEWLDTAEYIQLSGLDKGRLNSVAARARQNCYQIAHSETSPE